MQFESLAQSDSSKVDKGKKSFLQQVFYQGNVSAGYEYGLLPFLVNVNPPQGNFKTEGNIGMELKGVPLGVSYYYSSVGNISGLNNYFTVRFDAQRFQQNLREKLLKDKLDKLRLLDSLEIEKQRLMQQRSYLNLLKDGKIAFPVDSSLYRMENVVLDSLGIDSIGVDVTYDIPEFEWNDSLQGALEGVNSQVQQLRDSLGKYRKYVHVNTDSLVDMGEAPSLPGLGKFQRALQAVQRFEIGMCYPNYSEFLVARIPIRGINMEVQRRKLFFAFTHGKTVNNIFLTSNLVSNNLNAARNLYNFFDFNNIRDGRKVTAFKVGYGEKNNSHFHVGMLYGLGKSSYLDTTSILPDVERNLVAEVDAKVKISDHSTLDLIYGKSAIQVNNINYSDESPFLQSLIDPNERTNAALGRYTLNLGRSGTMVKASARWVDPFFRSFGVGFMRSDNLRYQLQLDQKIGKKFKFGGFVRKEEDNLLKIYDFQNTILSYGLNLTYRPTRRWMLKADYRPIAQIVSSSVDSLSMAMDNWIANFVLNYNKRVGKTYLSWTNIYSHYQLYNGEMNNTYLNMNSSLSLTGESGWNELLSVNYFATTDTLGVPNVLLFQNDLGWRKRSGLSVAAMGKLSVVDDDVQWGYGGKAVLPITSMLFVEASAEKLVVGDFYNSILSDAYDEFPYYFSASVRLTW